MQAITAAQQGVAGVDIRSKFAAAAGVTGLPGMLGMQGANGGDFLAMLLGQMTSGEESGQDLLGSFLSQSTELNQDQLDELEKLKGSQLGAQMLAEMLFSMSPMMDVVQQQSGAISTETISNAATNLIAQQMEALGVQKDANAQGKQQADNQTAELFNGALEKAMSKEAATLPVQQLEGAVSDLSGNGQFKNAVMQAQKMLKGSKQESPEDVPVNVEQLQSHADSARGLTMEKTTQAQLPDAKSLADQVKNGILKNMNSGKDEFVVKLKPDGLGEITVKLVEHGNKISMSILTSDSQVAKLLGSEIASLRESLKPFNADVREIVSQSDASYQAAHNGQQGFTGGQNHYQNPDDLPRYYTGAENVPVDEESIAAELLSSDQLNAYI